MIAAFFLDVSRDIISKTFMNIRTRIAPSPTGSPHIGTAYAALFNYCFAKKNNGDFVLRIEDTDRTRFVETSEDEINEALNWLGLEPDEGPIKGGSFGPYRQSERLNFYKENVEKLVAAGKAYHCDCSPDRLTKLRESQQRDGVVPHYDRKCRYKPPETIEKTVVRLAIPEEGETFVEDEIRGRITFQNKLIDDQVLLKSDGFPTYHLASVVDDHLMEISHVIRAEEWLSSTPKHSLLYKAFGWEEPKFAHLPLLRNPDRSKISKRKNPVAVNYYREQGYLPEALRNFLGLMGWSMPNDQEIFTLEEMIENFSFDRFDVAGPIFDLQKLEWLNGEYVRSLADSDLSERLVCGRFSNYPKPEVEKLLPLVKERLKKLSEFNNLVSYFFEDIEVKKEEFLPKTKNSNEVKTVLNKMYSVLKETSWSEDSLEQTLSGFQESTDWSRKELFMTIRLIITGSEATPPLFATLEKLGKNKTLSRLTAAIKQL